MIKEKISQCVAEHNNAIASINENKQEIETAVHLIITAINNGHVLFICGNGGSAADAQHLATEFVVRFRKNFPRQAFPALALTTDSSLITACANDFGFEYIFKRQIDALGKPGDVLLGISTSGNSKNVLYALEAAKNKGLNTIMLTGKNGGKCDAFSDCTIAINHSDTARIQETHITIEHLLCQLVEEYIAFVK